MAISLGSNPSFSNVLIKICLVVFNCGVMIADAKAMTVTGMKGWEKK